MSKEIEATITLNDANCMRATATLTLNQNEALVAAPELIITSDSVTHDPVPMELDSVAHPEAGVVGQILTQRELTYVAEYGALGNCTFQARARVDLLTITVDDTNDILSDPSASMDCGM